MGMIPFETILKIVCKEYWCSEEAIRGRSKANEVLMARKITYWLASKTGHTHSFIGRQLDRDHTTVSHGAKVVEAMMRKSPDFAEHVQKLKEIATDYPEIVFTPQSHEVAEIFRALDKIARDCLKLQARIKQLWGIDGVPTGVRGDRKSTRLNSSH